MNLLALGQQLVEVRLAADAAQRRLRDLRRGVEVVLHLHNRAVGVEDAEIEHGAYFDGDVVAGDDVLRGHVEGDGPQVEAEHLLDERDDVDDPGTARRSQTSQP